ncbi:MAG: hypothetical protein AMXMBFR84_13070 [Candidatus Hydrogenedentota bacterium]
MRTAQFSLIPTIFLGVLLAGCNAKPESTANSSLVYWRTLTGSAGEAQDELVRRFNSTQDICEVTSEFQGSYSDLATKLLTSAAAKTGPNVTQLGTFEIREFAKAGLLVNLTPFLQGTLPLDTSAWPASLAEAGVVDGNVYWLPFNVAVPVLYYNQDAFTEAGVNQPPGTWKEFYEAARKLTRRDPNGRVSRAGIALWNITWPLVSMIWSEGGELTNRDYTNVTLNDPIAIQILSELQQLAREGCLTMPDKASGGHRAAFISGRSAMILDSQDAFGEVYDRAAGFTPALAQYPAGAKGKVYAPGGGGLAMISTAREDQREAAWSFIRYMLAPESIAYYSGASGYVAFTPEARELMGERLQDPRFQTIHDALQYVRADFSVNMSPPVRDAFDRAFHKILLEDADVKQTLDAADAEAEAVLAASMRNE